MLNVENRSEARQQAVREERQAQRHDAEQFVQRLAEQFASRPPSPSQKTNIKQQLMTQFHLPEADAEALLQRHLPNLEPTRPTENPDLVRAQPAQADAGPQPTTPEPPATQQVPAGEEAAQSNTAKQDPGSQAGAQAKKSDFQRLATGVARDGTTAAPASAGRPPPTAASQTQAARPPLTTTHPSATPGRPPSAKPPPATAARQALPQPRSTGKEANLGQRHANAAESPLTRSSPLAQATDGTTPRGDLATNPVDPSAPEASPDADHPGTFVSQRTGGRVKITCSSTAKAAEDVQKYAGAVVATAEFRCLQQGGVVPARGGAQTAASRNGEEASGTDENSPRSAEGERTKVSQKSYRVSRWREQGFMRG